MKACYVTLIASFPANFPRETLSETRGAFCQISAKRKRMKSKREKRKLIWIIGRFEYDNGVIELCNWICAKNSSSFPWLWTLFQLKGSIKRHSKNYAEMEEPRKWIHKERKFLRLWFFVVAIVGWVNGDNEISQWNN